MKRLFTFGCSFTQYRWPTWADILGKTFEHYENWGQAGAGNQYIFNSLIECDARNKLTSEDTVIIMWTNIAREDRYVNEKWVTPGNIFTQRVYDDHFIKNFSDIRGYLIRDLATISAAIQLLEKWEVGYHLLSMVPLDNFDQYLSDKVEDQDVIDLYSSALQKIKPSVYEIIFNFDYDTHFRNHRPSNFPIGDHHPLPMEHLNYLQAILPEYNTSDEIKEWVNEVHNITYTNHVTWENKEKGSYWKMPQHLPKIRL